MLAKKYIFIPMIQLIEIFGIPVIFIVLNAVVWYLVAYIIQKDFMIGYHVIDNREVKNGTD